MSNSYLNSADVDTAVINLRKKIFGFAIFNNKVGVFEPNLKIATPKSYVIGPDDELIVDINGYSEEHYTLNVSPDGFVKINRIGNIYVSGLTIEDAKNRIIKKSERQTKKLKKVIEKTKIQLNEVEKIYKKSTQKFKQLDLDEFVFNYEPKGHDILNVANTFYKNVKFEIPKNYDYLNIKNDRKKTFNYAFSDDDLQLENLLFSVYNNQKHTFKINISFGYTLIKETNELETKEEFNVKFKLYHATPNTRITSHPTTIDNKKDVDKLIKRIRTENLMHRLYDMVPNSSWHFYEYLYIRFDVYHMTTAIGKAHELPSSAIKLAPRRPGIEKST